jgi:hypothetical protein
MIRSHVSGDSIVNRVYCDECGWRLSLHYKDEMGDDFGPGDDDYLHPMKAEQHLCPICFNRIMKRAVRSHCHTDCRTKPCERGHDCWVNPFPQLMYLHYVSQRVGNFHPHVPRLLELTFGRVEGKCCAHPKRVRTAYFDEDHGTEYEDLCDGCGKYCDWAECDHQCSCYGEDGVEIDIRTGRQITEMIS